MQIRTSLVILFVLVAKICFSQIYLEKQTRHRFAQLNLGIDLQSSIGGTTKYFDENGVLSELTLRNNISPRFLIGGTHFWGHADIYIAVPLFYAQQDEANQEIQSFRGVETVFKFYPWRIEHQKLRPYIGLSLAPFYFEQSNNNLDFGNGPERNHTNLPILSGISFNSKSHLFDLGLAWNYAHKQAYYISRSVEETIETPPIYVNLSYRFMLETTISAESGWESGQTQEVTNRLAQQHRLNSLYFGLGLSSAFWLGNSSYNRNNRPYINRFGTSIMPDINLGYYIHQPDLNISLAYRGYKTTTNSYGAIQSLSRKSIVLECAKYLFDYHGFVPFAGPAISYERLGFDESFEGNQTYALSENQLGYGLTFGWDIRPNRIQSWILRTNLRWFPNLNLQVTTAEEVSFSNLEFNFIQLIIYPNRLIK